MIKARFRIDLFSMTWLGNYAVVAVTWRQVVGSFRWTLWATDRADISQEMLALQQEPRHDLRGAQVQDLIYRTGVDLQAVAGARVGKYGNPLELVPSMPAIGYSLGDPRLGGDGVSSRTQTVTEQFEGRDLLRGEGLLHLFRALVAWDMNNNNSQLVDHGTLVYGLLIGTWQAELWDALIAYEAITQAPDAETFEPFETAG